MKQERHMPDQVAEWLGKRDFDTLAAEEQQYVLQYMDKDTYSELHQAAAAGSRYFDADKELRAPDTIRKHLQEVLSQRRGSQTIWLRPVAMWKVAAVLLLMLTAFGWLYQAQMPAKPELLLVHDTVLVERKVQEILRVHDTVIAYHKEPSSQPSAPVKKRKNIPVTPALAQNDTSTKTLPREQENIGIRTLQPEDIPRGLRNNKGKSMEEDELTKQFGQFVFVRT